MSASVSETTDPYWQVEFDRHFEVIQATRWLITTSGALVFESGPVIGGETTCAFNTGQWLAVRGVEVVDVEEDGNE